LKINNISTNSGLIINYVSIYDPTGAAVMTDYAIAIGTGAPQAILGGDLYLPAAFMNTWWIDMAGFAGFGNDHAIKLVHVATGYIVDRAEYGNIGSEPEDTMPGTANDNALNPAATREIARQNTYPAAWGDDTNVHNVDFTDKEAWLPPAGATATATGPIGAGGNLIDITYTWTPPPSSVDIFYSMDGNVTWNPLANDPTVEGPPGIFPGVDLDLLVPGGPGTYWWICNMVGGADDVGVPAGGTPAEAGPYVYSSGFSPTDISVHESGNDILIDWTTGLSGGADWEVYRSMSFTGGFALYDTAPAAGMSYTDVGAYADGNNYAYIIKAAGDPTNSNMGYKLVRQLTDAILGFNWIGLPYKCDLLDVDDVMDDINADAGVDNTCDIFTYWDTTAQGLVSRTDIGAIRVGPIFPMNPGQGYQAHVVAPVTWKVVGADIDVGATATVALVDNLLAYTWITFPYNTLFADADQVMDQIQADGSGGDDIDIFTYWDEVAQGLVSRTDIGAIRVGPIFPINPGQGFQTHMVLPNGAWDIHQNLYYPP
jgi:hypothetical protein